MHVPREAVAPRAGAGVPASRGAVQACAAERSVAWHAGRAGVMMMTGRAHIAGAARRAKQLCSSDGVLYGASG